MPTSGQPPQAFRDVTLPDGSDPISKGIVRRVRASDGTVTVEVDVEDLGESLAERVVEQIRGAALTLPEARRARVVAAPHGEEVLQLPEVDHVVAVASAKGGVGKTTVSVALARALAESGFDVGLFDADIYGPNVPHLLPDVEGPILTNEAGQPVPLDADGIQVLSPGIAAGDPPTARRGAIAYGAVENLLGQGAWTDRDVLIVDMPAGSDDVAGATLEYVPVDGAVFVTTPFDASVDDTGRTVELFGENGVTPIAAVVNMNSVTCGCCGEQNVLFEDPADVDVPVAYELPFDRDLQRDPGRGDRPETIDALADTVETFIDETFATAPDDAVDLRGLPNASQVCQLSDELAAVEPDSTVRALVDDPGAVGSRLREDAGALLGDVGTSQVGTTGAMLEVSR